MKKTFIHLSDTHMYHDKISPFEEEVTFLFHTGDFCQLSDFNNDKSSCEKSLSQAILFLEWFSKQNAKYKILISGNHEIFLNNEITRSLFEEKCNSLDVIFLDDATEVLEIGGVRICGAGLYPTFAMYMPRKHAYLSKREDLYNRISTDEIDILLVHGQPSVDVINNYTCDVLKDWIEERSDVKYCLCGHIHELRGEYQINETKVINSSMLFKPKHFIL